MTAEQEREARAVIDTVTWQRVKRLKDYQDINREDLKQAAWARLCASEYDASRGASWATWVWNVVNWAVTDYMRDDRTFGPRLRGKTARRFTRLDVDDLVVWPEMTDVIVKKRVRQVWAALLPQDRHALRERHLPCRDVAEREGVTVHAIHMRRKKAKLRARKLAEKMGLKEAA